MKRNRYAKKGLKNTARTAWWKNILKDPVMHHPFESLFCSPGSGMHRRQTWKKGGLFFGRLRHEKKRRPKGQTLEAFRKGSLTVEASLAVPIFFMCMVTLICLMDIYGKTAQQTVKLQQEAEKAGYAAGMAGGSGGRVIDIRRPVIYRIRYLPFQADVKAACRGRVYAWTGRGDGEMITSGSEAEQLVYVTDNRSVYHTDPGCTHLSLSIEKVSYSGLGRRRNEYGGKYHACEKCVGKGGAESAVYISREGNRYHNSPDCGGLTRNVRMVRSDEVSGLSECSRCAAKSARGGEQ